MNVICVICSDPLTQTDDIFYTRCGHVFHHSCLVQWIERSKTCPQCRETVKESRIHRLYFTYSNNDIIEDNAPTLQERIDNLKFKILLKEKDIKHYTSKVVTLEKQNSGLRKEVRKLEGEMNQKNAVIHALKQQVMYFKDQCSANEKTKKELAGLQKKVEELKDVQTLLNAPIKDVNEMSERTDDPRMLRRYVFIIKKELIAVLNKCKQLRVTIRRLREELSNIGAKEKLKRSKLEMTLAICESEKCYLLELFGELKHKLENNSDASYELESIERLLRKPIALPKECLENEESDVSFVRADEPESYENSLLDLQESGSDSSAEATAMNQTHDEEPEKNDSSLQIKTPEECPKECNALHSSSSNETTAKRRRLAVSKKHNETSGSEICTDITDYPHGSRCSDANRRLKAKRFKHDVKAKTQKVSGKGTKADDSVVDLTRNSF